jgi:hypothetical protein
MNPLRKITLLISIILLLVSLICLYFFKSKPAETFTLVYLLSSFFFLVISLLILKIEISPKLLIVLISAGILIRLAFINTTPIGSDDIYRYMWDGKVQAHGINPYLFSPVDTSLNFLHSDKLPGLINFSSMKSIYFPLSQWIFYAGYAISGENVYGYKLLLFIFELITLFSIYLLIKKLGIDRKYILLYALCPLPIIQFAVDAHVDGFGLPFLILSLLFYLNNKKVTSLIFLGISFSIKPVGLVLLPILFFTEKTYVDRIKILIIPFAVFFIQFLPYIFTSNPFEAFLIYSKNWAYNGSVFLFLYHFIQDNQTARKVCSLILLVLLIPIAMSKKEFLWKVYYSVLLLFILSPVVHPWYITWIAILLPVYPQKSGILFICLSSLTAFAILNYKLYGTWIENPRIITLEYVPVMLFMIYEMFWTKSGRYNRIEEKKLS